MTVSNSFDKRLQTIPNSIISYLTAIDELKGRWIAGAKLHPQVLGRLKQSVLITSTGASTRIEGSRMEDRDIENLMKGLSVSKFKDRDVQEVKGYYELLKQVFESWQSIRLSESTIKHFHQELLKYGDKDAHHRGEYKTIENKVRMVDAKGNIGAVIFDTTPVYLAPIEMQELVEWSAKAIRGKTYHPLLVISNFIVEFLKIHPFQDGNGRLSRILTNLFLLQAGYLYMPYISHEKLIEDNKTEYYIALRKAQATFKKDNPDITLWLTFFLDIIQKQSQLAINLLSEQTIEQILSPKQLIVWEYLQKVSETTPAEIVQHTGVARSTVNQIINKLLNLHKVERIGLGSGTRYRKI